MTTSTILPPTRPSKRNLHANNLPGAKSKKLRIWRAKGDTLGNAAICLGTLYIEGPQGGGSRDALTLSTEWDNDFGLTAKKAWAYITRVLPELEGYCLLKGADPKKLATNYFNRLRHNYMTTPNGPGQKPREISSEHPCNKATLKGYERMYIDMYREDKPVSKAQLELMKKFYDGKK